MYRLLIVDDEAFIANGIKSSVDWQKLGIVNVSIANNLRQAKEEFNNQPFDMMICDIEMPQGNGLELFEWVREQYPQTECIFLTCHANFQYAKKALQLGSFEYLLKPVPSEDLKLVMTKLIQKIRKERESVSMVTERFWQDVLNQAVPSNMDKMMEVIDKQKLPYSRFMGFLPVVISIQHWEKSLTARDTQIMEYALRNALEEIVTQRASSAQIVRINPDYLLIVFTQELPPAEGYNNFCMEIKNRCRAYIEVCNQYLYCHLSCYIGKSIQAHEVRDMVETLMAFKKNQVNIVDRVILIDERLKKESQIPLPPMHVWSELIKQGNKKKLSDVSQEYLDSLKQIECLGAKDLQQFYQNFLQMILHTLQQQGLRADEIFSDHLSPDRIRSATRSVKDLQDWVKDVLEKALAHIQGLDSNETVVEKIKRYIALHIDQELSRQYIADYIGLSPDYIVKLFKKETGLSISDYILKERINLAKELLCKTDTTISNVALSIGFSNFSYFSTLFKKEVSMTPQNYRKGFLSH
ncbi:response regulator transcription factor [Paenibacillus macquariensis]|uniref:Two-component system, response regulator YesN n=1 Tax=Paenibacillus macquariensis TaxID=948756 RepID=A0ABY1K9T5_9BACL|nr:response regulator [Paenibacillus macquariensis]MEC0092409.1 response regulator [Paenibacillus macquariensis]OAB35379.1 DNA-binding response regulator [Paenibacillus macquariensis subsp. macquariensis]SIR47720.1 two-component system, response regulator YesN [Paenibacillus macquariensis]